MAAEQTSSADSDAALLSSLLSQVSSEDLPEDEAELAELLRKLEEADGLAQGMEGRLDTIIGKLDDLLGSLQQEPAQGTAEKQEK